MRIARLIGKFVIDNFDVRHDVQVLTAVSLKHYGLQIKGVDIVLERGLLRLDFDFIDLYCSFVNGLLFADLEQKNRTAVAYGKATPSLVKRQLECVSAHSFSYIGQTWFYGSHIVQIHFQHL